MKHHIDRRALGDACLVVGAVLGLTALALAVLVAALYFLGDL